MLKKYYFEKYGTKKLENLEVSRQKQGADISLIAPNSPFNYSLFFKSGMDLENNAVNQSQGDSKALNSPNQSIHTHQKKSDSGLSTSHFIKARYNNMNSSQLTHHYSNTQSTTLITHSDKDRY